MPQMPKVMCLSGHGLPLADMARKMQPSGWTLAFADPASSEAERVKAASDADFILVFGHGLSDNVLRAARRAKLVQLASAGYDGVNLKLAGELGIPVANNGGANAVPVAEFALSLMLAAFRHLVDADRATRAGEWMPKALDGYDTWELSGKTVGIVGAGRIGSTVARLLRGFDTTTLYTDVRQSPEAEKHGARRVPLDTLLQESDIVTLHVPLLKSTRRLIGARELGLMKKSALLVNTCRGPVVDERALHEALAARRIWGAGLDVFETEPANADNPLFKLDNVVVAPHIAGKSYESYPRRVEFAYKNMARVWAGQPPESVVLPDE